MVSSLVLFLGPSVHIALDGTQHQTGSGGGGCTSSTLYTPVTWPSQAVTSSNFKVNSMAQSGTHHPGHLLPQQTTHHSMATDRFLGLGLGGSLVRGTHMASTIETGGVPGSPIAASGSSLNPGTILYFSCNDRSAPFMSTATDMLVNLVTNTVGSAVFSLAKSILPWNSNSNESRTSPTSNTSATSATSTAPPPPVNMSLRMRFDDGPRQAERMVLSPWLDRGGRVAAIADSLVSNLLIRERVKLLLFKLGACMSDGRGRG